MDSEFVLRVESNILADELEVDYEGKRATEGEFDVFGPSSWVGAGAGLRWGPGGEGVGRLETLEPQTAAGVPQRKPSHFGGGALWGPLAKLSQFF